MSCRGCAQSCSCLIEAGTNATVVGTGSVENPYIISLAETAENRPYNVAWGYLANQRLISGLPPTIGATYTDTGQTLTATTVAGRRYRVTALFHFSKDANEGTCRAKLLQDGVSIGAAVILVHANNFSTHTIVTPLAPTAGEHTWKVQMQTDAGVVGSYGDSIFARELLVEDIGPVSLV